MGNKNNQQKFMFFDNRPYEYIRGFKRRFCQPEKCGCNPLITPELPNEFKQAGFPGTVLYDSGEKIYKMWYASHLYVGTDDSVPEAKAHFNYAYSEDGLHFVKPKLDVVPGTNIVLPDTFRPHGPTVMKDLDEPDPARRYKLAMSPYNRERALCMYFSPDGIHWVESENSPFLTPYSDCHIGFYRDPDTGLYRVSMRTRSPDRRVWLSESSDCISWSRPVLVFEPGPNDPCATQFYGMTMTPYGEYIIGQISMYNTFDYTESPGANKMSGTMDVQFAYSRGGFCWHRCFEGERFISLGNEGQWDAKCITPSSTIVYTKNKMLFYYSGSRADHGEMALIPYEEVPKVEIGLATLRPDGFVCLEAGEDYCELMTRPFMCKIGKMFVNAEVKDSLIAEICDMNGNPVPGFNYSDCAGFSGDNICAEIKWTGNPENISGKPIRLKLHMKKGKLYSVFFPNGEDPAIYWRFREISCLDPERCDFEDVIYERRI